MRTLQATQLWRAGGFVLLLMAAGCTTPSNRIARYILKHPERPIAICTALQTQSVVAGMNADEVRLCLGSPKRIDRTADTPPTETWHYLQDSKAGGALKGSSIWHMDIPLATLYFSSEGLVKKAVFYNSQEADMPTTGGDAPSPRQDVVKGPPRQVHVDKKPVPGKPRPNAPALPHYMPAPTELGVSGWPRVSLGGVSAMGGDHSAILNGEVVEPGETVSDVTLFRVFDNGVLLEYRGQRTFLRPGETTK
jgi:outer membrane protein assembly factor BamE (lipoprotein component of BamABCDE complex)